MLHRRLVRLGVKNLVVRPRNWDEYLAKLIADKRATFEHLDSADVTGSAGAILIDATNKAEVTAIISEDPTVRAKKIEFEVIGE